MKASDTELELDMSIGELSEVTPEMIRLFVKELAEADEIIAEKRAELKKALDGMDDYVKLRDEAKALRESIKNFLETNEVVLSYTEEVNAAKEEKKDIIRTAKMNGVPKKEIDEAIRMLKKDVDPKMTTEIYTNIADLIDPADAESENE